MDRYTADGPTRASAYMCNRGRFRDACRGIGYSKK